MEIDGIATELQIANYSVNRVPEIEIISNRYAPVSTCSITLPDPDGELVKVFRPGDPVVLKYGYRGGTLAEWHGKVKYISRRLHSVYIVCRDLGAVILDTFVTEFFADDSVAAIVKNALERIGATAIVQDDSVVLQHFVASNISIYEIVRKAQHTLAEAFSVDMSQRAIWLNDAGWNWGDHFEILSNIPVISSEAGLIANQSAPKGYAGRAVVETWPIAGFRHSQPFRLNDAFAGVDSVFYADVVRHVFKGRTVRTFIEYR